jgi:hypothetical protein
MRTEACVCGGVIMAPDGCAADEVREHNESLTHQIWRRSREEPTAYQEPRDLSECSDRASAPSVAVVKTH